MKYFYLLLYIFIIILPAYLWWDINGIVFGQYGIAETRIYAIAKLMGIVAYAMFIMQLVLAARLPFIEKHFGQDKLMRFHRITGILAFLFVLAHPLSFDLYYWMAKPNQWLTFFLPGLNWKTMGSVSFILILLVVVLALWTQKFKLPYHWWKRIHMLSYIAVGGAFLHSWFLGSDIMLAGQLHNYWIVLGAIGAGALMYHKIIMPLWVRRSSYTIKTIKNEAPGIRSIQLAGKPLLYQPGQFIFVKFISQHVTGEWHPFTLSSSPTEQHLQISPKELGDWTSTLRNLEVGDTAYIQGPFGRFSFVHHNNDNDIVFIAGGIGITPFRSMVKYATDKQLAKKITLLYGCRSENDMVFKSELDAITTHYCINQRLDKTFITNHISDIPQKEYYVCGPPPMMKAIIETLEHLGVPHKQIHSERFALK